MHTYIMHENLFNKMLNCGEIEKCYLWINCSSHGCSVSIWINTKWDQNKSQNMDSIGSKISIRDVLKAA